MDLSCAGAQRRFLELLDRPNIPLEEVAEILNNVSHVDRVTLIRSTNKNQQRALWNAAKGFGRLLMTDMVPSTVPDRIAVHHVGKNSLSVQAVSEFEKRFVRSVGEEEGHPSKLYGYNHQRIPVFLTGPGYFVVRPSDVQDGELLIDYRRAPLLLTSELPIDWPTVKPNSRGLSRAIFHNMVDTLRKVSRHVTIGSAAKMNKKGVLKNMDQYFLLCREAIS